MARFCENIESEEILKICAVVDSVGYEINGVYYVRELAFANGHLSKAMEFQPDFDYNEINYQESQNIGTQTNSHGLKLTSKNPLSFKSSEVSAVLRTLYNSNSTWTHDRIGVANSQLRNLLDQAGIPNVNLTHYPFVFNDTMRHAGNWHCNLHPLHPNGWQWYDCALKSARNLWRFMEARRLDVICEIDNRSEFGGETI